MKSIIKNVFAAIGCMLMLYTSAYAEGTAVVIDDMKSGINGQSVTVCGNIEEVVLNTVSYNIRNMIKTEDEWIIGDDIIAIGEVRCENGSFSKNIFLPDAAPDGRYNIHIGTVKGIGDDMQFDYVSKSTREALCSVLSSADANGVLDALEEAKNIETAKSLGLNIDKYHTLAEDETAKHKTEAANLIVNGLNGNFTKPYSETDLSMLFNYAVAFIETVNANDVIAKLIENKDIFGLENIDDFYADELVSYIKNADIKNGTASISKVYNEALIVISFNKEIDYKNIMNLINNNSSLLNIDLTAYNKLSSEAKLLVQKDMVKIQYTKLDDITNSFSELVKKYKNYKYKEVSNSGGGGSSSVNGSSVPGYIQTEPQTHIYESEFTDLQNFEWASEAVEKLNDMGVISGIDETHFAPNNTVKREEFVKMIILTFFDNSEVSETEFTDADKSAWYYEYVSKASSLGIVSGYPDGSFGIGKEISRQDIAVMLYRVVQQTGKQLNDSTKKEFMDKDSMSEYAVNAIEKLSSASIINGQDNGMFEPHSSATRAEAAKLIYELYKH